MALKLLGRTGAVAGRDVAVADLLRIGAGADNDFRVVVGGVSRNHARIVKTEGAYWLEDAGSTNGTFLNGQRVARERLRHLDVVTLGRDVDLIIVTSDRADTAVTKAVSDAWLAPADAAGGPRVDLPVGEMTLGRLAPSNVILESPVISGLHARIQRTADQVVIQDLGSVNGTFVNAQRISAVTLLKDGDVLSIAGIRNFNVHVTGEGGRGQKQEVVASSSAVFDQEWKTKLVWSADELAQLEAERKKIIEAAAQRASAPAAPAAPAPLPRRNAPAAPAAEAGAAKPPAPAPPKPAAPPAPSPVSPKPVAPPAAAAPPAPSPVSPKPMAPPAAAAPQPVAPKPVAPPVAAAPAPAPPKPPVLPVAEAAPKPAAPPVAAPPAAPKQTASPVAAAGQEFVPTMVTPAARPPLKGVRLTGALGTFTLVKGRHTVGRLETANVPVLDLQVSRNHAAIVVGDNDVSVEDTKSANGTFVNGARAGDKPVTLNSGDRVAFGTVEFKVELMS
jgi:pSer/pThr/pTyr-binding forkhead associated (FHA) protein